jgi:hypothetical protein
MRSDEKGKGDRSLVIVGRSYEMSLRLADLKGVLLLSAEIMNGHMFW